MKLTKRHHRTLRKMILPLIAVAMMTTMMAMQSQAGAQSIPTASP
jgi:hypothetical protein